MQTLQKKITKMTQAWQWGNVCDRQYMAISHGWNPSSIILITALQENKIYMLFFVLLKKPQMETGELGMFYTFLVEFCKY